MHRLYYNLKHHLLIFFCAILIQFPVHLQTKEIQLFVNFLFILLYLLFFIFFVKMIFYFLLSYHLTFLLYLTLKDFFESFYSLKYRFFKMGFKPRSIYYRLSMQAREVDLNFFQIDYLNFINF